MPEPIDTSKLGPVKYDPNADSIKARVVKEALREWSTHLPNGPWVPAIREIADRANDGTLLLLKRLLKDG